MNGVWCNELGECCAKQCLITKNGVFVGKQSLTMQRHADQSIFFPTVSINGTAILALAPQNGDIVQVILPEPLDQVLYYGGVFLCCGELVGDAWRLLPLSLDKWVQCVRSWRPFDEAMMAKLNDEGIKGAEKIMIKLQDAMDGIETNYKKLDRKKYVGGLKRKHSEMEDEEEEEEEDEDEEELEEEEEEDDEEEEEQEDNDIEEEDEYEEDEEDIDDEVDESEQDEIFDE